MEEYEWDIMPDPVLLYLFSLLDYDDLLMARITCRNWFRLASYEPLWKRLVNYDFKINNSIPIAPGNNYWFHEYKRLKYHSPVHETEVLHGHTNNVLHVSFSHNGKMFASSSKDGYIKVWTAEFPAKVCHSSNMRDFSWNYCQYSQFNESDTLLLVSGVHFGKSTRDGFGCGEIAVFNLQGNFTLQCRVLIKIYDVVGTWYTDDYLISGRLHFLEHLESSTDLWLNKVCQESESEKKPIVKHLFKFYNVNANSIRAVTVANCCMSQSKLDGLLDQDTNSDEPPDIHDPAFYQDPTIENQWIAVRSRSYRFAAGPLSRHVTVDFSAESKDGCSLANSIRYSQEYKPVESTEIESESSKEVQNTTSGIEDPPLPGSGLSEHKKIRTDGNPDDRPGPSFAKEDEKNDPEGGDVQDHDPNPEKFVDPREKFLIFTTGSLTYVPHQIGFKRIRPFKETDTPSVLQRLAEGLLRNPPPVIPHEHNAVHYFDKMDHVIDLHGHIMGMGLSPDHRYLYVSSRPWPQGYVITNPLQPPPIAQDIDIHVIDLSTLKEVSVMLRSHRTCSPNVESCFIFLDVSDRFVASGAEDKNGYLWDRHYGNCLGKLPHDDVVNSVTFNPQDPEMLVTASDDFTMKVWRSKNRIKELNIPMDKKM